MGGFNGFRKSNVWRGDNMEGDAIAFLIAVGLGIIGAVLFVLGIQPSMSGNSANMLLVTFGVGLIILAVIIGGIMAVLGRGQ